MEVSKILSGTVVGTSAMTMFSYAASEKKNKQFKEPVLLGKLIERLFSQPKGASEFEGWLVHYAVGALFTTLYEKAWTNTKLKPCASSALILGAVSGLIGMGVWKKTLELHPNPPHADRDKYFKHLFAAHLVFGLFTYLGYKLPNKKM
jgi:hypothetical protein